MAPEGGADRAPERLRPGLRGTRCVALRGARCIALRGAEAAPEILDQAVHLVAQGGEGLQQALRPWRVGRRGGGWRRGLRVAIVAHDAPSFPLISGRQAGSHRTGPTPRHRKRTNRRGDIDRGQADPAAPITPSRGTTAPPRFRAIPSLRGECRPARPASAGTSPPPGARRGRACRAPRRGGWPPARCKVRSGNSSAPVPRG